MSKTILGRLQGARKAAQEKSGYETTYSDMVEKIRREAMAEARATAREEMYSEIGEVRESLNKSRNDASKAQAALAKAEARLATSDAVLDKAHAEALRARKETEQMKESMQSHMKLSAVTEEFSASLSRTLQDKAGQLDNAWEGMKMTQSALRESEQELRDRISRQEENDYKQAVERYKAERKRAQGLELALANKSGQLEHIKNQPPTPPPAPPVVVAPQKVPTFTIENVMRGQNDRIISATITPVETE